MHQLAWKLAVTGASACAGLWGAAKKCLADVRQLSTGTLRILRLTIRGGTGPL